VKTRHAVVVALFKGLKMKTTEIKQSIAYRQGRRDALQKKPFMYAFGAVTRDAYLEGYQSINTNPPPESDIAAIMRALRVIDEYRLSQGLDDDSDAYHALISKIELQLLELTK
jgi:hypothetical protein